MIFLYTQEKKSLAELGRIYGVTRSAITGLLKRRKIEIRPWELNLSQEQKESMKELYLSGATCAEIAEKYNMSTTNCQNIFRKIGILRTSGESHRKYNLNKHIFDEIDSEEKAWLLGFLFADGNVIQNQVRITLSLKDKALLEKISILFMVMLNQLEMVVALSKGKEHFTCSMHVRCDEIVEKLALLGMKPRKSLDLEFPEKIPIEFLRHFIRGYFDGDGCLSVRENRRGIFTIISSYSFTERLKEILQEHAGIEKIGLYKRGKVQYLCFSSNNAIRTIYAYLYENANIYLERKERKFQEYFQIRKSIDEKEGN